MPKTRTSDDPQPFLGVLADLTGSTPRVTSYKSGKRRLQIARFDDYPSAGLTTFVTLGASLEPFSMHRGLDMGFELTLTLAKPERLAAANLAKMVLENMRIQQAEERRPFIEYNGRYAPGYPPHFLFTDGVTCTPKLTGRTRCDDRWIQFLAVIPLDDRELREYDKNAAGLIAKLKKGGRVMDYPRK